ncbi:MAG TPA: bifunctional DNA primase/polymerase [Actinocrinis sp.]|uniref:bifunctional DNA primase/polymerase n=1 Tax=Actinocrinis sp. TaxID=1920516 RepID=UPI002DDD7051|nr:bifunctional DNA primase/polymerase [Actinocrinis sp.]HEV3172634.1 bifunctional DNA primase/polymerase [Actinocrinis sp.]
MTTARATKAPPRAAQTQTSPAIPAQPAPSPSGPFSLLTAALEYIEDQHWEIALGTETLRMEGRWACSCGDSGCPSPGAHPAHRDWQKRASGQPSRAHEWWNASPQASILLPTGRTFDVLDVPEAAGCLGLARMERAGATVGPVAATPERRMYFFVLPNCRVKTVKLLSALGWGRTKLDLACRGTGDFVVAPPSRTPGGHVQWVRPPGEANRWMPDVEELLAPLAYACGIHVARR